MVPDSQSFHRTAEDARVAIDRDTGTLLSGEDRDDSDPFEEEKDEDQLEEIDDC